MIKLKWGSLEHQRKLCEAIGYDWKKYDPKNAEEVSKMSKKILEAQLSGRDKNGKMLSEDDFSLLNSMTNWD